MEDLLRSEGLAELVAALRVVEPALAAEVREGLRDGGRIVQEQARRDFIRNAPLRKGRSLGAVRYSAEHFRTVVRSSTLVQVEQSLRKTTGLHPEWGALQMREGLLPARAEKLDEVAERIELGVGGLLHKHGF